MLGRARASARRRNLRRLPSCPLRDRDLRRAYLAVTPTCARASAISRSTGTIVGPAALPQHAPRARSRVALREQHRRQCIATARPRRCPGSSIRMARHARGQALRRRNARSARRRLAAAPGAAGTATGSEGQRPLRRGTCLTVIAFDGTFPRRPSCRCRPCARRAVRRRMLAVDERRGDGSALRAKAIVDSARFPASADAALRGDRILDRDVRPCRRCRLVANARATRAPRVAAPNRAGRRSSAALAAIAVRCRGSSSPSCSRMRRLRRAWRISPEVDRFVSEQSLATLDRRSSSRRTCRQDEHEALRNMFSEFVAGEGRDGTTT